jgi:hypothetical protein
MICIYDKYYQLSFRMNSIIQWELVDLYNRNSEDIKKKILLKINQPPSASDRQGYVYGFYSENDRNTRNNFWIKLGRTEQSTPAIRIKQWNGKEAFSINTSYDRKLERLIHLFFDFARKERPNGLKVEIEWFNFVNSMDRNTIIRHIASIDSLIESINVPIDNNFSEPLGQSLDQLPGEFLPAKTRIILPESRDSSGDSRSVQLDLKTCSEQDLTTLINIKQLRNIGRAKIQLIIQAKTLHGVRGIGKETIAKLFPYVTRG